MGSKASENEYLHDEREQSEDVRITHSTPSVEDNANSELWKIAGQIYSKDIDKFGTILGFSHVQLDHLKGIYHKQPQRRNYILLKKWCDVVETKYGNHRRLLAKLLSEAEYKNISDNMNEDISEITIHSKLTNDLSDVCFDIPNSNETSSTRQDQAELAHDCYSTETFSNVSRKECMLKMLKDLKLEKFHPSKISLPMINEIIENSTNEEVTKESIPWSLLRKFMNLNYEGREADINRLHKCHSDEHVDGFDDDKSEETGFHLHPLDVFLLSFLCCDPILQQELVSKMFFCRLAVPFIYRTLEDKLIMSKWAFRKIVINRKTDKKCVEDDVLSQFVKIVSFIRVGPRTQATISKSKLINKIISEQTHFTFFSQNDCISFETEKLITNGMVEASWFIPSRSHVNEANVFQDMVMFLNLRGDSLKHEEEVSIVTAISDVIVVHIDAERLTNLDIIHYLKKIHSIDKFVVYGVECRKGERQNKATLDHVDCFKTSLDLKEDNTNFIKVEGEIKRKTVENFQKKIQNSLLKKKAKVFSEVLSSIKFGDDNFSVEGYTMAKGIMDFIDKQVVNDKCPLFPLQGSIWADLCDCTKKLCRSRSQDEHDQLREKENGLQQKQFELIKKSRTLQIFNRIRLSEGLDTESSNEHLFFIAWMKSFMDERLRAIQKYEPIPLRWIPTDIANFFSPLNFS